MQQAILDFFNDGRTLALLGLIFLDLISGIMAALVLGKFAWTQIASFYRTKVLPFLIGYLAVYLLSVLGLANLPEVGPLLQQFGTWAGAAVAIANLLGDIASNLGEINRRSPDSATTTVTVTPPASVEVK